MNAWRHENSIQSDITPAFRRQCGRLVFFCLTIELYERMFGKIELPDGIKTENGGET